MPEWKVECADAIEVMRSMPDGSVDMIFTDPPYGHNNNNGDLIHNWEKALGKPCGPSSESRPIANDGAEAIDLFREMIVQASRVLHPGCVCCCCCCGGGGPDPQFAKWSLIIDEHLQFCQQVIWDKGPMGMGWRYRRSYEVVLVAFRKGVKMRWYTDRKDIENILRPSEKWPKILPSADMHPTPKPPGLAEHFICLHTEPGHLVLDPFCGGGSTGVAAVRSGRRFHGIEIDEHWAEYSMRRIERETDGMLFC